MLFFFIYIYVCVCVFDIVQIAPVAQRTSSECKIRRHKFA